MNENRKPSVSELMTISYYACLGFLNAPFGSQAEKDYHKIAWDAKMGLVDEAGKRGYVYAQNAWCLAWRKHRLNNGNIPFSPNVYIKERVQAIF